MSTLINKLKIFNDGSLKNRQDVKDKIKFYHVFKDKKINALFVTDDDQVYGIGNNYYGQLGLGDIIDHSYHEVIKELEGKQIREFFVGCNFVLGLTSDRKLYSWGCNSSGRVGRNDPSDHTKPGLIILPSNVKQVSVSELNSMVLLDNGKVFVWGNNEFQYLGNGYQNIRMPVELMSLSGLQVKCIYNFRDCLFAITTDNKVYSWGYNSDNRLGYQVDDKRVKKPKLLEDLPEGKIIDIKSNLLTTYFLYENGKLCFCGEYYVRREKFYQQIPIVVNSEKNFTNLGVINKKVFALSGEQMVYELKGNQLITTNYKSMEEYCIKKYQITHKTYCTKMRDCDLKLKFMLGKGGFGAVYKVYHNNEYYAVKKIEVDKMYKEENEMNIMKRLDGNYVVKLHDYWRQDDIEHKFEFLYIQMEFCDQTLADIITIKNENKLFQQLFDYVLSCEIFDQLLRALDYLHTRQPKIIHRDLKPSNVLVKYYDDRAQLKLCDFGLSKMVERESQTNTSSIGTQRYQAPELSKKKYDEKVDIYSLGILSGELFARWFDDDDDDSDIKSLKEIIQNEIDQLSDVKSNMVHGEPKKRPSCSEIVRNKNLWAVGQDLIDQFAITNNLPDNNEFRFVKFLNN